jgi:hypothetical protein
LASLICPEVARPSVTINRILKRMSRDGYILQVPQVKDRPYLYMPNPSIIHPQSNKIEHFMAIADLYIAMKQPKIFEVEPMINDDYRADAYIRNSDSDKPVLVEIQRTVISTRRMQAKVDEFVKAYLKKQHDAQTLWIISDVTYRLEVPAGFSVVQQRPFRADIAR